MIENERPFAGIWEPWEYGLDFLRLESGVIVCDYHGQEGHSVQDATGMTLLAAAVIIKGYRPWRGHELRFVRGLLDMTQAELAEASGAARPTIARWEENWNHAPRVGRETEPVPEDEVIPEWGERAARLLAGAAIGLSGMERVLRSPHFRCRRDDDPWLVLKYTGDSWEIGESTFGRRAGLPLAHPLRGRRFVARVLAGNPYGDEADRAELGIVEDFAIDSLGMRAAALAKAHGANHWHAEAYNGTVLVHNDPAISFNPPFRPLL